MDRPVADELLEVLQAHRENRLQPPPIPPVGPEHTVAPEDVQWQGDEGQSQESSS